ncbi:MAG: hypothetical protein ACLR78_04490 [Roseburia sp.]
MEHRNRRVDPDTDRNPGTPDLLRRGNAPSGRRRRLSGRLRQQELPRKSLDIAILGTSSPDRNYPSDACSVQAAIGAVNAVAFDISAACAGFIFAMNIVRKDFKAGILPRRR